MCDKCIDKDHRGKHAAKCRCVCHDEKNKYVFKSRVGYHGHYFVIIPDHAAGLPGRFTTYRVPASPSRSIKIIGRELTLAESKRIIERYEP